MDTFYKVYHKKLVIKLEKGYTDLSTLVISSSKKINSQDYLESSRQRPQDFMRDRKMPFEKLICFMLNMVKGSTQTCLDHFFELIGRNDVHMTQQAFSEARQKIKWEAFQDLFLYTRELIYEGYNETWHGYRITAIDGTKLQLPDDSKLRDYYGTIGKGNIAVTGQASALYDIYNNILIDVQLEPISTDERELAQRHISALYKMPSFGKECILFDRGYPSFELIETQVDYGIKYVMRVRRGFNNDIDKLRIGAGHSVILHKKGHNDIPVRVIKFLLPSGEMETLITNIFDMNMGINDFKQLYFKRWPIETKYDEIKNKLEVENFSGRTVNAVKQDFYISMYLSNIISVACREAQEKVSRDRENKDNIYEYHVNVNQAIGTFKDRFIKVMLLKSARAREKKIKRILYLLTGNAVPTRPNRSLPRNPSPRKAKFRHNRKSNC